MPSCNEIIDILRCCLRDVSGIRYSDGFLLDLFNDAQREFARDTGLLIGEVDLVATRDGYIHLPSDYIRCLDITDNDGDSINVVSWRYMNDVMGVRWMSEKGNALKAICFDVCTVGELRTYPIIEGSCVIGKMKYARFPAKDTVEFRDTEAIMKYITFFISVIEERVKDMKNDYKAYTEYVNRYIASYAPTRYKNPNRKGVFF